MIQNGSDTHAIKRLPARESAILTAAVLEAALYAGMEFGRLAYPPSSQSVWKRTENGGDR